jgi:hypothetical protein
MTTAFADRLDGFLDRPDASLITLLREYFDNFGGRFFDSFARNEALIDLHPYEIRGADLIAVACLSVDIPGVTMAHILNDLKLPISEHLAQLPRTVCLWDDEAAPLIAENGPANALWNLVENEHGIGWVIANKLLAQKRPLLLPVYDSVVKAALQPDELLFWQPLRETLRADDGVRLTRLRALRAAAGLNPGLSELRVLDVIVWRLQQELGSS